MKRNAASRAAVFLLVTRRSSGSYSCSTEASVHNLWPRKFRFSFLTGQALIPNANWALCLHNRKLVLDGKALWFNLSLQSRLNTAFVLPMGRRRCQLCFREYGGKPIGLDGTLFRKEVKWKGHRFHVGNIMTSSPDREFCGPNAPIRLLLSRSILFCSAFACVRLTQGSTVVHHCISPNHA